MDKNLDMSDFDIGCLDIRKNPKLKDEDFGWLWNLKKFKPIDLKDEDFDWLWNLKKTKQVDLEDIELLKKIMQIDLEDIDALKQYRMKHDAIGEFIYELSKENILNYIENNLNIRNIECIYSLIKKLNLDAPSFVENKKGFIFNKNNCGDFSCAFSGTHDYDKYYEAVFFKNLIEKYKLDSFQASVLLINPDLLYSMFYEYRGKEVYDMDYSLFDNSITDRIIKNIKLLTNDDLFNSITTNQFASLQNSPILFQNNSEILKRYPNITNSDLIKLSFLDKKLIIEYIKLLNECDEESKNIILDFIQPLKSSNCLFPSLIEDIRIIDNKPVSKFQEIIKKNSKFFNEYNYFFQEIFDHKFLGQIINNRESLKILLALKNAFLNNMPEMIDTRHTHTVDKGYWTHQIDRSTDCTLEEVWEANPVTVTEGILDYKEETTRKYVEIIFKIKNIIISNDSDIDISKLISSDINPKTRDFLTSFLGEYYLKKSNEKVKRYVI